MGDSELAWAAGFFDGEGAISISVRRRPERATNYDLTLFVGQADPRPLEAMKRLFGGTVRFDGLRPGMKRPQWRWQVGDRGALAALRQMVPFLVVKDHEAIVAMLFYATKGHQGARPRDAWQVAEQASFYEAFQQFRDERKVQSV